MSHKSDSLAESEDSKLDLKFSLSALSKTKIAKKRKSANLSAKKLKKKQGTVANNSNGEKVGIVAAILGN
jgi:hypothetical protein